MSRRAFTLVELLVVIAIIGLLSTIAITSLSSARRQSRNAKRLADIKQLVTSFSLGLDANGTYPSTGGDVWKCISSACTGGWVVYTASGTVDAFFTPFMAKPTDPDDKNFRGQGGYSYDAAWVGNASFPPGSYINYTIETPASSCGVGVIGSVTANYVNCFVQLY